MTTETLSDNQWAFFTNDVADYEWLESYKKDQEGSPMASFIPTEKVREFIKRLKEELCGEMLHEPKATIAAYKPVNQAEIWAVIEELAGKELSQ